MFNRPTLGLLVFCLLGCGGTVKRVRSAEFSLSGRETTLAEEYEAGEPKGASPMARCGYWQERASEARGSHIVGVVDWPAEYFSRLHKWVDAKRDDACSGSGDGTATAKSTAPDKCGSPKKPLRKYLATATRASLASGPGGIEGDNSVDSLSFGDGPTALALPANTVVEFVRVLPDMRKGTCMFAEVRIVDAGGVAKVGASYVVPVEKLADEGDGPSIAEATAKAKEEKKKAAQATLEKEVADGKCSDDHVDALRGVANGVPKILDDVMVTSKLYKVATATGVELEWTPTLGGEYHLVVVGFAAFKLKVTDGQAYAVKTESRYADAVRTLVNLRPTDGREVNATAGDKYKVRIEGLGCVLVMVLRKI